MDKPAAGSPVYQSPEAIGRYFNTVSILLSELNFIKLLHKRTFIVNKKYEMYE